MPFRHYQTLLSWLAFSLLSPTLHAQFYDLGTSTSELTHRDDSKTPIIIGRLPTPENTTIPFRLEIREFRKNNYMWDLYILALSMFQGADQNDPLSWYQIAGIHGVPFEPWNGVEPVFGASQSGYCTHSSVLFPMWHRPYLALFEQQMYKMVNAIALMFTNATEQQLYQQAASSFRIPYWDWSLQAPRGETHLPDVFWSPLIQQYGPNGMQDIWNPLYSYRFHPVDEERFIWQPMNQWNETKRAPDISVSLLFPPSETRLVNDRLLSHFQKIKERLYILFSNYHDFNSFSNKAWAVYKSEPSLDSIEAIHDAIHYDIGIGGHMSFVPLSSFDPLFFLHHAMTDRLITIWQILNPTAWVKPMPSRETSFTSLNGTLQTNDSPLTPFYAKDDGTFWTSKMARSTDAFGYAYADTSTKPGSSEPLRDELTRKINNWYGTSSPIGLLQKVAGSKPSKSGIIKPPSTSDGRLGYRPNIRHDAEDLPASRIVKKNQYTEWIANVEVNVEALDGSFAIHFFIGPPPLDEVGWHLAPNLAGTVAIFAMDRMTGSKSKISGAVPLTSTVMKMVAAGVVHTLAPRDVEPFLKGMLYFAVQLSNGSRVDAERVDGLHISVSSANVHLPKKKTQLPKWGRPVTRLQLWPKD